MITPKLDSSLLRVEAAALMPQISIKGESTAHFVGIPNHSSVKRGDNRITAPGGACRLTQRGHNELVQQFGARFSAKDWKKDDRQWDARFLIEGSKLDHVINWFKRFDERRVELSPARELTEEFGLCPNRPFELPGQTAAIISAAELLQIDLCFGRIFVQPPVNPNTENNPHAYPMVRIFYLWQGFAPESVFAKLADNPWFYILSNAETKRLQSGMPNPRTDDGRYVIANNIVPATTPVNWATLGNYLAA